jgi:hypothetical protein
VPVIVAGTVYGVFELGEKLASQRAKDALSKWLVSFDVQKAKTLPDGTREIFAKIFGERHFSLKCVVRSVAFSFGAMGFIGILLLLINPVWIIGAFASFFTTAKRETFLLYSLWLPWSIIIDYISLFKTRVVLRYLPRVRPSLTPTVLIGDYMLYRLLFALGSLAIPVLYSFISGEPFLLRYIRGWFEQNFGPSPINLFYPAYLADAISFLLFWAGFVPSIWMWLYVLALFVTRTLLRSEQIVKWLRWGLDVEKAPFRSIGAVAAALAFVVSVAILLVSAEISRITAAA